jgi:alpha-tubulin suppressor-like RCC1 family protein
VFGDNSQGQLGLSPLETESFHIPKQIFFFTEKVVTWLSAGHKHSGALTVEGYLYTWGGNKFGQLSQGDQVNLPVPKLVENQLGRGLCNLSMSFE